MAQRLRTLAALPEVLSSVPSNNMVTHNQRQNTVHIINKSLKKMWKRETCSDFHQAIYLVFCQLHLFCCLTC